MTRRTHAGRGAPAAGHHRMVRGGAAFAVVLVACYAAAGAGAQGRYIERDQFLSDSFAGHVPEPRSLWITSELRGPLEQLLGHAFAPLRVRYWRSRDKSAWILDEIGKERPITFGVTVSNGAIERLRVLEFRETRGSEIRFPFFTDQFEEARLDHGRLNQGIDSITGATLSAQAAMRVARLALFLDEQIREHL